MGASRPMRQTGRSRSSSLRSRLWSRRTFPKSKRLPRCSTRTTSSKATLRSSRPPSRTLRSQPTRVNNTVPRTRHCSAVCSCSRRRPKRPTKRSVRRTRSSATDVKAGHFERKVQALEQERDQWEQKYEEMAKKHSSLQKELDDLQQEIGTI